MHPLPYRAGMTTLRCHAAVGRISKLSVRTYRGPQTLGMLRHDRLLLNPSAKVPTIQLSTTHMDADNAYGRSTKGWI